MLNQIVHSKWYMKSSLRPVASVKLAVAYCFGDMVHFYVLLAFKVGNGAGHFEDAAVGTGREREALHGAAEETEPCLVRLGVLVYHALCHLCVAVYVLEVLVPLVLYGACGNDAAAYLAARLARLSGGDVAEGDGLYLTLYVDTV